MTNEYTITLPKLGESIMSATIVQWFKKPGDTVALDEPLLEVATDKVNSEIPSPVAGTLTKVMGEVDQELDVGAPLAIVSTEAAVADHDEVAKKREKTTTSTDSSMRDYYSPAVLKAAREKGISMDQLSQISGSGSGGRITRQDVENYETLPPPTGEYETIKLEGMRKAIADNMTLSHTQIPSASLVTEVDVTDLMAYIQKEKAGFLEKYGAKLSITSFIARAICQAAKKYPMFNASLRGGTIYVHKQVNLGIAVSLEKGLMVPVIKGCDSKKLCEVAKAVAELGRKARDNKLAPDDVMDGTITMTNFGMGGTLIGIPIIRHPEAAIVGIGAIEKKVTPDGVRDKVYISATFDHRLIDGMDGCAFLAEIKQCLEKNDT